MSSNEKPTITGAKEYPPKVEKRNHLYLDSSIDNWMNFTNIAQDLDDIKNSLEDNIKKGDVTQEVLLNNWTLKTLYTSYYVNWKLT